MLPECESTNIFSVVHSITFFTCFNSSESREIERDAEMMRLQILGDPHLMQQLREVRPRHRFSTLCVQTPLTAFILRHNRNWQTPHNPTPLDSISCYVSSAKCKRTPKSNVNGRSLDSKPTLSISKPSKRSKRPLGNRPCSRIWNTPWSTDQRHLAESLCSSRCQFLS